MDATNSVSITGGGYAAQISLLGGQLLNLTHHEDELIVPAAGTEGAFAGAVLAPWPNRTKGGRYTFNGVEHLLPVNEEATGAALHGLLIDLPLRVISQKDAEVQLAGWLESSEGYPFGLDIALTYRVSADLGLAATLMARYRPEVLAEEKGADQDEAGAADSAPLESDAAEAAEQEVVEHELATSAAEDPDAAASEAAADVSDAESTETESADTESTATESPDSDVPEADVLEAESSETESSEADSQDADSPDSDAPETKSAAPETSGAAVDETPSEPAPQTAPFGAGFHPYLTAGGAPLKECRLRLPARTMLKTKADGTVTGRKSVSQDFDLTNGPLLAGRTIDHAFTDLPEEGWTAELVHGPSGFVVRMIADSPWVQVYTGERIDRAGIAVEPMSCPPNALNSGEDLVHLVPGKWFRMGYSIEAFRAD